MLWPKYRHTSYAHDFFDKPRLHFGIIVHGVLVVARGFLKFNRREENSRLCIAVFDVSFVPMDFTGILHHRLHQDKTGDRENAAIRF